MPLSDGCRTAQPSGNGDGDGPWRAVQAVLQAARRDGLAMMVIEREGDLEDPDEPPVLWVVNEAEGRAMCGVGSSWAPVDDLLLARMATNSPAWELADLDAIAAAKAAAAEAAG